MVLEEEGEEEEVKAIYAQPAVNTHLSSPESMQVVHAFEGRPYEVVEDEVESGILEERVPSDAQEANMIA